MLQAVWSGSPHCLNLKARPVSPKSYIPGCWAARSFASNATLTAGGGERSACSFAACQPRIVAAGLVEDAKSPITNSSQTRGIVASADHDSGLLMHGWPGGCGRSSRTCSSVLRLGFFCFIRMQTHSGTAALAVASGRTRLLESDCRAAAPLQAASSRSRLCPGRCAVELET